MPLFKQDNVKCMTCSHPIACTHLYDDVDRFFSEKPAITTNNYGAPLQLVSKPAIECTLNKILSVISLLKCLYGFPQSTCAGFLSIKRLSSHFARFERHVVRIFQPTSEQPTRLGKIGHLSPRSTVGQGHLSKLSFYFEV